MTVNKSTFVSTPSVFSYNIPANQYGDIQVLEGDFPAGVYQGTSMPNNIYLSNGLPGQANAYNAIGYTNPEVLSNGTITVSTNSYKKGFVYVNTRWMSRGLATSLVQSPGTVNSVFGGATGIVVSLAGGYVRRSTDDGVNWASSQVGQVSRVTYHNGIYFGTNGTYLYTSPAATVGTWTTRTIGLDSIKGISYLPTSPTYKYLAKGYTANDKVSTDGYTWVSTNNGVFNNSVYNYYAEAVGSYWFGTSQLGQIFYSSNGTTWTQASTPNPTAPSSPNPGSVNKIAYGNGVYVAVYFTWNTSNNISRGVWRSTNGTTWTTVENPGVGWNQGTGYNQIATVAFGYGAGGVGKFIVTQHIPGSYGQTYALFATSTDGITWIPGYGNSAGTYNMTDAPTPSYSGDNMGRDAYGDAPWIGTYNNKWYYVKNDTTNFYLYNDQTARGTYTGGVTNGVVTYYGDTNSTLGTYLNTQI